MTALAISRKQRESTSALTRPFRATSPGGRGEDRVRYFLPFGAAAPLAAAAPFAAGAPLAAAAPLAAGAPLAAAAPLPAAAPLAAPAAGAAPATAPSSPSTFFSALA